MRSRGPIQRRGLALCTVQGGGSRYEVPALAGLYTQGPRRRGALGSAARLPVYCRVAAGEHSRTRASPGRSAGRDRIT